MKTEINNENKAKFFAQYWGQMVYKEIDQPFMKSIWVNAFTMMELDNLLLLTPLSLISDEDAIEVSKHQGWRNQTIHKVHFDNDAKDFCVNYGKDDCYETVNSYSYQYLQSKGYALPWMDLSVEQLVEAGWIQLRTEV